MTDVNLEENALLAAKLREMADLLDAQSDDGFRVRAYRRAAGTLESLDRPVRDLLADAGLDGLVALPGIGRGIASAISEMLDTGRWIALDRLTGTVETEQLFQTVPGIGSELARRIHDELHLDTLEALERAAHDGRLEKVPGVGVRRAASIRAVLSERLGHRRVRPSHQAPLPDVALLLDVDREYRSRADAGTLRTIAPKRFNPEGTAWLPIMHGTRGDWFFTALFSNTQRAHELGRTRDWVVIYFHQLDEPEAQCTVVTGHRGPLAGRRLVRGRGGDCIAYYAAHGPEDGTPSATSG